MLRQKLKYFLIPCTILFVHIFTHAKNFEEFNICRFENLVITGTTNVSEFSLLYDHSLHDKEQVPFSLLDDENSSQLVCFYIPVQSITGSNKTMIKDFRNLFNSEKYPYIKVGTEKHKLKNIENSCSSGQMNFLLSIAGITKKVRSEYSTEQNNSNSIVLNGTTLINLTDFNIQPPEKFFGIIKVKNEVFINFKILLSGI